MAKDRPTAQPLVSIFQFLHRADYLGQENCEKASQVQLRDDEAAEWWPTDDRRLAHSSS